jgi:hypothetical protein
VSRYKWISAFGEVGAETGRDELFGMLAGGAEIVLGQGYAHGVVTRAQT